MQVYPNDPAALASLVDSPINPKSVLEPRHSCRNLAQARSTWGFPMVEKTRAKPGFVIRELQFLFYFFRSQNSLFSLICKEKKTIIASSISFNSKSLIISPKFCLFSFLIFFLLYMTSYYVDIDENKVASVGLTSFKVVSRSPIDKPISLSLSKWLYSKV